MRRGRNPFQLLVHQPAPMFVEPAPAAKRRHQPRSGLRVEPVNREDHPCKEAIARSVTGMKGPLICGEAPDERTQAIRSEEHTSELQSLMRISYAVFCLNKKNQNTISIQEHS